MIVGSPQRAVFWKLRVVCGAASSVELRHFGGLWGISHSPGLKAFSQERKCKLGVAFILEGVGL